MINQKGYFLEDIPKRLVLILKFICFRRKETSDKGSDTETLHNYANQFLYVITIINVQ